MARDEREQHPGAESGCLPASQKSLPSKGVELPTRCLEGGFCDTPQTTPAYKPTKSAREVNCFRLASAGFVPSSRTITRTISASLFRPFAPDHYGQNNGRDDGKEKSQGHDEVGTRHEVSLYHSRPARSSPRGEQSNAELWRLPSKISPSRIHKLFRFCRHILSTSRRLAASQ
jgi:hypothetical protein